MAVGCRPAAVDAAGRGDGRPRFRECAAAGVGTENRNRQRGVSGAPGLQPGETRSSRVACISGAHGGAGVCLAECARFLGMAHQGSRIDPR